MVSRERPSLYAPMTSPLGDALDQLYVAQAELSRAGCYLHRARYATRKPDRAVRQAREVRDLLRRIRAHTRLLEEAADDLETKFSKETT